MPPPARCLALEQLDGKPVNARPEHQVLAEARAAWAELLSALESPTDDELADPSHFARLGERPGVLPWQIFAGGTFWHYKEHAGQIRAWWQRVETADDRSSWVATRPRLLSESCAMAMGGYRSWAIT